MDPIASGFSTPGSPETLTSEQANSCGCETHEVMPHNLLSIIRQWAEPQPVAKHAKSLLNYIGAESIEVVQTSRDLSEMTWLFPTAFESPSLFERISNLPEIILEKGPLARRNWIEIRTPKLPGTQLLGQVTKSDQQGEFLLVLMEGKIHQEDPFFTTACKLAATLLLNSAAAELATAARDRSESMLQQSQRLASVGQLTTGVAHDFNNLLTVIQGHLVMLEDEATDREEALESIDRIHAASDRAVELSRQLLSLGKEQEIVFRECDINEIIRNFAKLIERMLEENIEVSFDLSEDLGTVEADPGLLTQILMNLVVNARDAMPGGGKIDISTRLSSLSEGTPQLREGDYISLRVKDSGSGIPKENLPRVFDPFFSTKDSKGTGLGLANVAAIMRQHGGQIDVSSKPNVGTEFEMLFPQKSKRPKRISTPSQDEGKSARTSTQGSFQGVHVLLVEDEQSVRKLVRKLLEMLGCQVTESPSGKDALERWPELSGEVTMIVSDVMMPGGVSGWELAREIHKTNPNLGILLTSGYNERPEDHGLGGLSEISFLQKPYDVSRLKEELQSLALAS